MVPKLIQSGLGTCLDFMSVQSSQCAGLCPIRKCAQRRGAETCGSCPEMEGCVILGPILKSSPDARKNLTEGKNR